MRTMIAALFLSLLVACAATPIPPPASADKSVPAPPETGFVFAVQAREDPRPFIKGQQERPRSYSRNGAPKPR